MGIVAGIGAAAAAGSLASSVSNLAGGSSGGSSGGYYSGSSPPPAYLPQNQAGADSSYWNTAQQLTGYGNNLADTLAPQYLSYLSGWQAGSPQFQAAQNNGAASAGNYLLGLGPQLEQNAGALGTAGSAVLNTAFDPQNALYNRTQQQTTDQANAINAMYGLSSSPYGAGVANQANENFNIDWQNQQLARQAQGIQSAGAAFTGQAGLGQAGASDTFQGASLPYQTYNQQYNDIFNMLGQANSGVTGATGLDTNSLNALAAYLKLGQSATSVGQAGSAQNFAQNQALGAGLGSSLSGLASAFGGSNNSSSSSSSSGLGNWLSGLFSSPSTYAPGSDNYNYYSNPSLYSQPESDTGDSMTPY